jgi:hypothetical protein
MIAGFKDRLSFRDFERETRNNRRYIHTPAAKRFLAAVRQSCSSRVRNLREGYKLWRAQLGCDWDPQAKKGDVALPYSPERMKPLRDSAFEGRVNSKGIPLSIKY